REAGGPRWAGVKRGQEARVAREPSDRGPRRAPQGRLAPGLTRSPRPSPDVRSLTPASRGTRSVLVEEFLLARRALLEDALGLRVLLDQEALVARGALLAGRLVPRRELAVGIATAAVENLAPAAALLRQVAGAAFGRAADADRKWFRVAAVRIVLAGAELAIAAVLLDDFAAALRALLTELDERRVAVHGLRVL